MRMRVLLEPHHGASYDQILALARTTEEAGFDAFFRSDHYLGIDAEDTGYRPTDSWTTLAGLAVQTERVRLGTLMTASTYRRPGPLAITVATVDAMSGGRAELGIGAAWYEREHRFFGIPFPPLGERFDRLGEQLEVITGLWRTAPGEVFSYHGKHYQLEECASIPRPARTPPIIIGGAGPRRTPALAARFADEFNSGMSDGLADRFANFRRVCREAGRDPGEVRLSTTLPVCCGETRGEAARRAAALGEAGARMLRMGVTGAPGDVAGRLAELRAAGADTVYFHLYDVADLDHVRLLGREVLPRLDLFSGRTDLRSALPSRPRPSGGERVGGHPGRRFGGVTGRIIRPVTPPVREVLSPPPQPPPRVPPRAQLRPGRSRTLVPRRFSPSPRRRGLCLRWAPPRRGYLRRHRR